MIGCMALYAGCFKEFGQKPVLKSCERDCIIGEYDRSLYGTSRVPSTKD